jgi:hypothetical protein
MAELKYEPVSHDHKEFLKNARAVGCDLEIKFIPKSSSTKHDTRGVKHRAD